MPRWFIRPRTVVNPSTNPAAHGLDWSRLTQPVDYEVRRPDHKSTTLPSHACTWGFHGIFWITLDLRAVVAQCFDQRRILELELGVCGCVRASGAAISGFAELALCPTSSPADWSREARKWIIFSKYRDVGLSRYLFAILYVLPIHPSVVF